MDPIKSTEEEDSTEEESLIGEESSTEEEYLLPRQSKRKKYEMHVKEQHAAKELLTYRRRKRSKHVTQQKETEVGMGQSRIVRDDVVVGSFIADGKKESKMMTLADPASDPGKLVPSGTTGANSPPSRGTLSESSGGPGSPLNHSTGACNNSNQQGLPSMPWK